MSQLSPDWALLSSDLRFRYLDPVLTAHLGAQAQALLSKNLLDFVHPDERENARIDLYRIIDQKGLHGSVTRVRYQRLSKVREMLGCNDAITSIIEHEFPEASKIVYDDCYMTLEIVINWVADHPDLQKWGGGVILCFIHAAKDIDAVADNDERNKTAWSNWCGTPLFEPKHIESMYACLATVDASLIGSSRFQKPSRTFQILSNTLERQVLFSWPPSEINRQFAKIAKNVNTDFATDAKTSCQRRFCVRQTVDGLSVESIFIIHGTIIFACHLVDPAVIKSGASFQSQKRLSVESYYDVSHSPNSFGRPVFEEPSNYESNRQEPGFGSKLLTPLLSLSDKTSGRIIHADATPTSGSTRYVNDGDYYTDSSINSARNRKYSRKSPTSQQPHLAHIPTTDRPQVPTTTEIPRVYSQSYSSANRASHQHVQSYISSSSSSRGQFSSGKSSISSSTHPLRVPGDPPPGVIRCISCKTTVSPEWRKGPSGKKELCNACGLRYARSKAKKEGHQPQKRRREGQTPFTITRHSSGSRPLGHPNPIYGTSGGEFIFHQHGHPSPSQHGFVPSVPSSVPSSRDTLDHVKGYSGYVDQSRSQSSHQQGYHGSRTYNPPHDEILPRRRSPNFPVPDKYLPQYHQSTYSEQMEVHTGPYRGQSQTQHAHSSHSYQYQTISGVGVHAYGASNSGAYPRELDRHHTLQQPKAPPGSHHTPSHFHPPLPRINTLPEDDLNVSHDISTLSGPFRRTNYPPGSGSGHSRNSTPDPGHEHQHQPLSPTVVNGMSNSLGSPSLSRYEMYRGIHGHNQIAPSSYERGMHSIPMTTRHHV